MVGAHNPTNTPNISLPKPKKRYRENSMENNTHISSIYSDVGIRFFILINMKLLFNNHPKSNSFCIFLFACIQNFLLNLCVFLLYQSHHPNFENQIFPSSFI